MALSQLSQLSQLDRITRLEQELDRLKFRVDELEAEKKAAAPKPEKKFYDTISAGELLGINPRTVKAWIKSGKLKAVNIGGEDAKQIRWRIAAEDLEAIVAKEKS